MDAALAAAPDGGIHISINIAARTMYVYSGNVIIRSYPVGVGMPNFPTPEGQFEVISKVEDPVFESPFSRLGVGKTITGKRNPLGTRWIGFLEANGGEYGIHGTNAPSSVGKLSSHGCVRMRIADSEELFDLVEFGTPIEVVYEVIDMQPSEDGNELVVKMYPDVFHRGWPSLGKLKGQILAKYPGAQIDENGLAQALNKRSKMPTKVAKNLDDGSGETRSGDDQTLLFRVRIQNTPQE